MCGKMSRVLDWTVWRGGDHKNRGKNCRLYCFSPPLPSHAYACQTIGKRRSGHVAKLSFKSQQVAHFCFFKNTVYSLFFRPRVETGDVGRRIITTGGRRRESADESPLHMWCWNTHKKKLSQLQTTNFFPIESALLCASSIRKEKKTIVYLGSCIRVYYYSTKQTHKTHVLLLCIEVAHRAGGGVKLRVTFMGGEDSKKDLNEQWGRKEGRRITHTHTHDVMTRGWLVVSTHPLFSLPNPGGREVSKSSLNASSSFFHRVLMQQRLERRRKRGRRSLSIVSVSEGGGWVFQTGRRKEEEIHGPNGAENCLAFGCCHFSSFS